MPVSLDTPLVFSNFANANGLQLNGNASLVNNTLQLTPNLGGQRGSAFTSSAYTVDANTSFQSQFQFRLGGGTNGADGFAFVLQNAGSGARGLGSGGGGVGYGGLGNSLAIQFDTYQNSISDPNGNHISILTNGDFNNSYTDQVVDLDLNSGEAINAWVEYNGGNNRLTVSLSNTAVKPATVALSTTIDLAAYVGSQAYVGFTAGTGGRSNSQSIENWTFGPGTMTPDGGTGPVVGTGTGLRGEYFDTIDFTDLKVTRVDPTLNFNWGNGSPDATVGADTFSVRWTGQVEAQYDELYNFYTTSDDGVRLFVDGQLIIDNFVDQGPTTRSGQFQMAKGTKYDLRVEYYDRFGNAGSKLEWSSASQFRQVIPKSQLYAAIGSETNGTGDGLKGEYFDNRDFTTPVLSRVDRTVNFEWGLGSPDARIAPDTFSVRWTGQVQPRYNDTYTFFTTTDDGVRVTVDGQVIIDRLVNQPPTTINSRGIALRAGERYNIAVEYYENGGGASAKLGWFSRSQAQEIVPQSQLYSTVPLNGGIIRLDTNSYEVREADGTARIKLVRENGSEGVATVTYRTVQDSATDGTDYTGTQTGLATFNDGQTTAFIDVPLLNDSLAEGSEIFGVSLGSGIGAGVGLIRTANVTIVDDDAKATYTIAQPEYSAPEADGKAIIEVKRGGSTVGAGSVRLKTTDGTAVAGSDYTAIDQVITFVDGQSTQTVEITLIRDGLGERNETLNLALSEPTAGIIGSQNTALLNVLDSDPGSFDRKKLLQGLTTPTAIEWTPDGRYMFILQQDGVLQVADTQDLDANGQYKLKSKPFVDLSAEVNGIRDRGALGLAIDPQFANGRPYVYVLYTYDPPEFGNQDTKNNRPSRLMRIKADGNKGFLEALPLDVGDDAKTPAGENRRIILGRNSNFANTRDGNSTGNANIPASGYVLDAFGNNTRESVADYIAGDSESHSIGDLKFGLDGKLYLSTGDASSYSLTDPRAFRVQDIDNLSGKILRIDPDTGNGFADNPFYNTTKGAVSIYSDAASDLKFNNNVTSNRSKVFSFGLRNPFRFTINPTTGKPYIGDVGYKDWEEINVATPGANHGWAGFEGGDGTNVRTPGYLNVPDSIALFNSPNPITAPIYGFRHQGGGIGDSIGVGPFYKASAFPQIYDGTLFFNNISRGVVSTLTLDANGAVTGTRLFDSGNEVRGITQMKVGPDGNLYYVTLGVPIDSGIKGTGSVSRWQPKIAINSTPPIPTTLPAPEAAPVITTL
jgi:glucose/arabinose dehydrogenase